MTTTAAPPRWSIKNPSREPSRCLLPPSSICGVFVFLLVEIFCVCVSPFAEFLWYSSAGFFFFVALCDMAVSFLCVFSPFAEFLW